MSDQYLGEIRSFSFNFAPVNWALCNGQIIPITQNTALFSLLGTTYGGNGQTTFALPDLRGRVPMHFGTSPSGSNYVQGENTGVESVQLTLAEVPAHNHLFYGSGAGGDSKRPVTGSAYAQTTNVGPVSPGDNFYALASNPVALNPLTIAAFVGANLPHTNIQPYLTISWCIALSGIFPSRN